MGLDLAQILYLTGCSAAQIAAAGKQRGFPCVGCPLFDELGLLECGFMISISPAESLRYRDDAAPAYKSSSVLLLQARSGGFAAQSEMFAPAGDRDIKYCFDLP